MPPSYPVYKFGSSVLTTPAAISKVARYIADVVNSSGPIIAVVSAFENETDRLFAELDEIGCGEIGPRAARYVALGETRSAYLLSIALENGGVAPHFVSPRKLSLTARGSLTDAVPEALNTAVLYDALQSAQCVIVPGFAAIGSDGADRLLGRGGSDLTAVFIAREIGASAAVLVKDVDGLYDRDPNHFSNARRYRIVSWEAARTASDGLIQDKTLCFARDYGVALDIVAITGAVGTRIEGHDTAAEFDHAEAAHG